MAQIIKYKTPERKRHLGSILNYAKVSKIGEKNIILQYLQFDFVAVSHV